MIPRFTPDLRPVRQDPIRITSSSRPRRRGPVLGTHGCRPRAEVPWDGSRAEINQAPWASPRRTADWSPWTACELVIQGPAPVGLLGGTRVCAESDPSSDDAGYPPAEAQSHRRESHRERTEHEIDHRPSPRAIDPPGGVAVPSAFGILGDPDPPVLRGGPPPAIAPQPHGSRGSPRGRSGSTTGAPLLVPQKSPAKNVVEALHRFPSEGRWVTSLGWS